MFGKRLFALARWVVVALALAGSVYAESHVKRVADEMPIVAWGWPFKSSEVDAAHYRLIRDCGCNHTIQWVEGLDGIRKCLDAAEEAGIRLLLHSPTVVGDPEKVIPQIKNHPALAAYYLADEPPVQKMKELGAITRRIRAVDDAHPVYMNWFGIVDDMKRWYGVETFDEYLDTSIREVPAGLYTFDVYPIYAARFSRPLTRAKSPLVLRKDWYATLEAVSERSCRTDVPFWAFAAVVPIRNHKAFDNPMPTVAHLKLQQYSNLAYGAQGLQYYDFCPRAQSVENYLLDGAPLSPEGRINPSYWRMAEVNRELQARADVFLGSVPVRIRHAGNIPQGTLAFDARRDLPGFVTSFVPDGDLLVSVLRKGSREVFVVVNRDPNAVSAFTATFAPGVKYVRKNGTRVPACDGAYPMDIGEAEIFVSDGNGGS